MARAECEGGNVKQIRFVRIQRADLPAGHEPRRGGEVYK